MENEKTPEEELEAAKARGDVVEEEVSEDTATADEVVAEDEDEPGDEAPEEEKPITIPKARFDEAQRKARERQEELERRIAEMESKTHKEAVQTDSTKLADRLEELSTEYEKLLLDGEIDKARTVRRERDKAQNDLFDLRLQQNSKLTSTVAVEQMRFDAQLAQFEAKFPAINPDSTDFNQELADEVSEVMNAFQAKGFTMAAALNKAMHYVIRDDEPRAGEDPDIVRSKRGQQGRKRVADAMKKMPPDIGKIGKDSTKAGSGDGLPDVTKMSPEQFAKLSEEDLKKLRGDSLADEEAA